MSKRKSDKYRNYASLDKTQLQEGYSACLENAARLIDDAKELGKDRFFRTGYLSLLLASEELGKAILLYIGQTLGNRNDWNQWWSDYHEHSKKQAWSMLALTFPEDLYKGYKALQLTEDNSQTKTTSDDTAGKKVAQLRMKAMYVDFDLKNRKFVSPPTDNEIESLFQEELPYAERMLAYLLAKKWEDKCPPPGITLA